MADNTQVAAGSGDFVRDKDRSGVKTQIVGLDVGIGTATEQLLSPANPMPVYEPDGTASGTITATDTVLGTHNGLGVVLTGTPTAGSYVAYALRGGESGFTLRLSGTFGGGTVWIESSPDSTNGVDGGWVTNLVRQSGVDITSLDTSLTAAGVFRGVAAGYSYLRVRITGATSPSVGVAFRASLGPSVTAQVASLPPGTNTIGGVNGGTLLTTTGAIAATGTGTVGPLNVGLSGNVTFTVKNTTAASAWAGNPVIVFEQSDDNTSWSPLVVVRNDTSVAAATHVLPPGTANAALIFDAPAESVTYVRARVTTGPTTNGLTIDIAAGGMPFSPVVAAITSPIQSLPMGSTTGTTPALTGQVGRSVRATATAAFTTAQTLIAAPAAGTRIYVTNIVASNEGSTFTVIRLFQGTSAPAAATTSFVVSNDVIDLPLAATGGGATVTQPPNGPWALPLATALGVTVSAATTWDLTVFYYVAP